MEFDLVVRDGMVIDGTGSPAVHADVGVVGDRIVTVGNVEGRAAKEIDAEGLVVTPGFVDAHTHMDAQVFWDDLGKPTCWHGVTSVVMGNCGFTLAPAKTGEEALVVRSLERAEDIAPEAMAQGITWTWQDFSEYLNALDGLPKGVNYAASIGHSALRTWAMGERAFDGPADDDDLAEMAKELRAALRAGAAGFTTSRSSGHATSDDRPVASRLAAWDEVVALVDILGHESEGIFQLAPERYDDPAKQENFESRLRNLAVSSGAPIAFGVFAQPAMVGQLTTDYIDGTVAAGGEMFGLTHSRGIMTAQSFLTRLGFDTLVEWQDLRSRPLDEQKVLLQDPELRSHLVHAAHHGTYGNAYGPEARKPEFETLAVMLSAFKDNPTVADEAKRRGVDPVEAMIDIALEHDFDVFFVQTLVPQEDELVRRVLRHPRTAMCFSDSGAHVSQVFDSSIYTHLLAYWVREREAFTLEEAIAMITSRPAHVWRLHDRGRLQPGCAADITVFDPATVAPLMPELVHDVPGAAPRIEQRAAGFKATVVNGRLLTLDGEPGEERPGRLLRRSAVGVQA
jgi:N-acyl-D-aspartate/D-glutamate deacylase